MSSEGDPEQLRRCSRRAALFADNEEDIIVVVPAYGLVGDARAAGAQKGMGLG